MTGDLLNRKNCRDQCIKNVTRVFVIDCQWTKVNQFMKYISVELKEKNYLNYLLGSEICGKSVPAFIGSVFFLGRNWKVTSYIQWLNSSKSFFKYFFGVPRLATLRKSSSFQCNSLLRLHPSSIRRIRPHNLFLPITRLLAYDWFLWIFRYQFHFNVSWTCHVSATLPFSQCGLYFCLTVFWWWM